MIERLRSLGAVEASCDGVSARWAQPPAVVVPLSVPRAVSPEQARREERAEELRNLLHSVPGGDALAEELAAR